MSEDSPPSPDDELLDGRELHETESSSPDEVDGDEERPLPLTLLTQTKNHRDLLDFFLTATIPDEGLHKTAIADGAGISTNGVRRHIDVFLAFDIVEEVTSDDARISRYTNNPDSEVHRALQNANNILVRHFDDV